MYHSRSLVDGIQSCLPKREDWVSKSVGDLPDTVDVRFGGGQTGKLEMRNPRAVHWAKIIDKLEKAREPVYVEIDEESKVITKVLVPRIYKVQDLESKENGDYAVKLIPSSAMHFLLKSDPKFDAMLHKLRAALDDDSELLITETRDEHKISTG